MIDEKLLLDTLEDMNALYLEHGERMLKQMRKTLLSIDMNSVITDNKEILAYINEHLKSPSPLIAKRLLRTLCYEMEEKHTKVNQDLSAWFTNNMDEVLNGVDFKTAFGMKHKDKNRPKNSFSVSDLRIAAAHEFYLRETGKRMEAKKMVEKKMGVTERRINRAIKALPIPDYIQTSLLEELSKYDYIVAFGYRQ